MAQFTIEGGLKVSYALIILIFMIMFDYFLGGMLWSFAETQTSEIGILMKLSITFVLAFGTFVVPMLIIRGFMVNPFNMLLGVGSLLIGIVATMFIYQVVMTVLDTFLPENTKAIGWLFVMILLIIVGFIAPVFIMLKQETIIPIPVEGGEQQ